MTIGRRYCLDTEMVKGLQHNEIAMIQSIERKFRDGIYQTKAIPCCICGRADYEQLSEKDRHGVPSRVVICRHCGLVQTNPQPTLRTLVQYYAQEYQALEYNQAEPAAAFFQSQRERGEQIYAYLNSVSNLPRAGARILEVGCNSGGILHYFREKGFQVCGVDLNQSFTAFGRAEHGLDLSMGTIADIPEDWMPDLVIYSHTLEHVPLLNDELARVREILRDGGVLYVQVPGIKDLRTLYSSDFLSYIQFAHTYHFSLRSLTNLLEKNHFRLVAGDESVNAVFAKDGSRASQVPQNDYSAVMSYLRSCEREHTVRRFVRFPISIMRYVRRRLADLSSDRSSISGSQS